MLKASYDIIIIGAGPAGLIAAIECHTPSADILVTEKMSRPAVKLRISGKGRCNITNDADLPEFIKHFGKSGRFLRHAFAEFFNTDLLKYFEELGVKCKLERGGRWFPESDNAGEVAEALCKKVRSLDIPITTKTDVTGIYKSEDGPFTVTIKKDDKRQTIRASKVLLAAGGKSYPKTGSDGSGYTLATRLEHTITPLSPSLVALKTKGQVAGKLQGLSLKNVNVNVWCNRKKSDEAFGEMVFTDTGVSGPVILTLSRKIVSQLKEKQNVLLSLDLKPALDHKKLDERLKREIEQTPRQSFKGLLKNLLPRKMISVFVDLASVPENKQLCQITAPERKQLRMLLKEFQLEVTGHGSFDRAIITSGGVSTKEINPQTMESKLVKDLYLAGEIIDIDADTGGYNLQAAFSTGWLAGRAMPPPSPRGV